MRVFCVRPRRPMWFIFCRVTAFSVSALGYRAALDESSLIRTSEKLPYLLEKRRSALPIPREKGKMTMATEE